MARKGAERGGTQLNVQILTRRRRAAEAPGELKNLAMIPRKARHQTNDECRGAFSEKDSRIWEKREPTPFGGKRKNSRGGWRGSQVGGSIATEKITSGMSQEPIMGDKHFCVLS